MLALYHRTGTSRHDANLPPKHTHTHRRKRQHKVKSILLLQFYSCHQQSWEAEMYTRVCESCVNVQIRTFKVVDNKKKCTTADWLLTTTSWHPLTAFASCRRGRRLPAADVGRHRCAFSGQAWCPWSAASPSCSRCLGKCSAVETWVENEELFHPAGDGESDSRVSYVSPRVSFSPLVSQLALFLMSWSLLLETVKVICHR